MASVILETVEDLLTFAVRGEHADEVEICQSQPDPRLEEFGRKLQAKLLLSDPLRRILVPSRDEWIGLNLLERDDQLPPRRA